MKGLMIGQIIRAPLNKGYVIYRGDAALWNRKTHKILHPEYKIDRRIPYVGKGKFSWTTDIDTA